MSKQNVERLAENFTYAGTELKLFARAKRWKSYVRDKIERYVKGDILDVGAGIGIGIQTLYQADQGRWLCLEPDPDLFQELESSISALAAKDCSALNGTIDVLGQDQLFDCILYLDVLEHIDDDKTEIAQAARHLKNGGCLVILAPAHQWLFTPFDSSIGHYRRYCKSSLASTLPASLEVVELIYMDSLGLLLSLANKVVLRQDQPTLLQIRVWDTLIIPISKRLDLLLGYHVGKTVLLIGKRRC